MIKKKKKKKIGLPAAKKCAKCKVLYCSKEHQLFHWRISHQKECSVSLPTLIDPLDDRILSILFKEMEILTEPEEYEGNDGEEIFDVESEMDHNKHVEREEKQNKISEGKEEEDSAIVQFEGQLDAFQKRIKKYPDQVLRYNKEKGEDVSGFPIWPYKTNIPDNVDIPDCENCKSPRIFEFQILPQLIYFISSSNDLKDINSIDFASVTCYTCSQDCVYKKGNSCYMQDFVWVQKTPNLDQRMN